MSNISTTLYQYLTTNYGQLDWTLGSVIRELVAAPITDLSEQAIAAINSAYNDINITSLIADPEGRSDAIDKLFSDLGLAVPSATVSSGTVKVLLNAPDDAVISSGVSFNYNDITLYVQNSYKLTLLPSEEGDILLKQVGLDSYEAIIPVNSALTGVNLGEGTELSWTGMPSATYSATVYSPITGGVGAYTATQRLNRIRQLLFPIGISCPESLLRTINSYAANTAADCLLGANSPLGTAEVFVKPVAIPEVWEVTLNGVESTPNTYQAQLVGTAIESVISIEGADYFSSKRHGRTLVITYTGAAATAETKATVLGSPSLITAQTALDNYTRNTGVLMNVRAPNSLYLEMYLPVQTTGSSVLSSICSAVNNSALNVTALGDITTRPIIQTAGVDFIGNGVYTLKDMTTGAAYGNPAVINPVAFLSGDTPYAVYTSIDRITTNG